MKINKLAYLLPLSLLLVGCASDSERYVKLNLKYMSTDKAPITASDKNAQTQIAEAASSVSQSLQQLDAIEMANNKSVKLPGPLNPRITGLTQIASIDWNGPLKPIVARIAKAGNYKLRIIGQAPSIKNIVNIDVQNKPLADILRNVTFQAEPQATIKVYPQSRTIELRYNKLV